MEALYDIYYAGEVLEGHQVDAVRERLEKLFKADSATLDRLFSGTPQLLKRDCDRATALKYKQAMENAGARPLIQRGAQPPSPQEQAKPRSAAEKIAALAAAPDEEDYRTTGDSAPAPAEAAPVADDTAGLQLNAPHSDVLRPEERAEPVVADIDTSALDLDEAGGRLSAEPSAPPPAPDTSHLAMGEVGEAIPTLAPQAQPLDPDTSALGLSPEGTDFSDCAKPSAPPPDVDLSGIDVAPAGADVIEDKYRKKARVEAPDTDHIKLED